MAVIDDLTDKLAIDVIKAMDALKDDTLADQVASVLGASSPSSEEMFRNAIRNRLAERRARSFLNDYVKTALKAQKSGKDSGKNSLPDHDQKTV